MRPKTLLESSGASRDLNTFKEDGVFTRYTTPSSTAWEGLHYPEKQAGYLQVYGAWDHDRGVYGTYQTYTTYLGSIYVRFFDNQTGNWSSWKRQATTEELDAKVNKSDIITTTSQSTSKTKVVSGYNLAATMRQPFVSVWTGNTNNVQVPFEGKTYGLEVIVYVDNNTAFRFDFPYASKWLTYKAYYSASDNAYITVKQGFNYLVLESTNCKVTGVDARQVFIGEPL